MDTKPTSTIHFARAEQTSKEMESWRCKTKDGRAPKRYRTNRRWEFEFNAAVKPRDKTMYKLVLRWIAEIDQTE